VTYVNVFSNPIADSNGTDIVEIDNRQNQVKFGDMLFTTSSETPEEVGMSSVWLENTENVYLNSFCFGYRPRVKLDPYYAAFMFRSPKVRKNFILLAQGISRYNISKNKVMEMSVPVPNMNEQKKVGEFFTTLDTTITFHQRESLTNLYFNLSVRVSALLGRHLDFQALELYADMFSVLWSCLRVPIAWLR
jgi:Restriction endonuclease S subunits